MRLILPALIGLTAATAARAGVPFELLTGVDVGKYPGAARIVTSSGGGGFAGTFYDGDRLAGTSNTGPSIVFQGSGTPMFPPNHVGALSFLYRRGSVPFFGQTPFMGIDFLGGPLLDLDGDLGNGVRSLIPVSSQTPVVIPGSYSHLGLAFDFSGGTVSLDAFDATGTNEGAPGIQAEIATTLVTIAGTTPTGGVGVRPNSSFDTRTGTLTTYTGIGGTLTGVYRIQNLQAELWYDSIDPNSSSADALGTLQHFGRFRGWLVLRDCNSGTFPTLAGQGLGSTLWPLVDVSEVGQVFNTAIPDFGPIATIEDGVPGDQFSAPGNGGLALTDAAGDLGVYFDSVVAPLVGSTAEAYVYLEAAGFGINNSGDPIFSDTISYDVVLIARAAGPITLTGDVNGDGSVSYFDAAALANVLVNPEAYTACQRHRADVNGDGSANGRDVQALLNELF
jgi:hypothetical protein